MAFGIRNGFRNGSRSSLEAFKIVWPAPLVVELGATPDLTVFEEFAMIDHVRFSLRLATVAASALVGVSAVHGGTPTAVAAPVAGSHARSATADGGSILMDWEEALVGLARDVTVSRQSSMTSSGSTTNFEINASATNGSTVLYSKTWTCSRPWFKPNACDNFEARRTEFFNAALSAHRAARDEIARAFDVSTLVAKNGMDLFEGAPFFLVNNLSTQRNYAAPGQPHTCLDVGGDPGTAVGATVHLRGCQFDRAEPTSAQATDHVWRFVPGTGLLQNVLSGLCLDVAGSPAAQVNGTSTLLAECDFSGGSANADQQWGLHPLGYLVNLSSGRCLDMNGATVTSNGGAARVINCEYGLTAKPNSLGSSQGLTATDTATDQSWSLSFLDGGLDPLLPSHLPLDATVIPPQTTITAAPSGSITHHEDVHIEFGSNMVGSTFVCKFNSGDFVPCTSPFGYDIPRGALGGYSFSVRATNRYGLVDPTAATTTWQVVSPDLP